MMLNLLPREHGAGVMQMLSIFGKSRSFRIGWELMCKKEM